MKSIFKTPTAWIPLVMSGLAFLLMLFYVVLFGSQPAQTDESSAARIFQLLLVGQIPLIAYYVIKTGTKYSMETLKIAGLQIIAIAINIIFITIMEK